MYLYILITVTTTMEKLKKLGYIYKITSPSKKIYIGQTFYLSERKCNYKSLNCKKQKIIYNSLLKYGWGNRNGAVGAVGAVATDVVLQPAFQSLQTQIQTLQGQVGANDIRNEMESVENTFATISSGQTSANAANFNALGNQIGNLQTAQAAANYTTLDSINGLGRDITAAQNQAALQQLNSFNQVTTTILQGQNSLAMQSQNSTNQIIAQGTAMAAQVAQCCCEIKSVIATDGALTRALINDLNVQNLRDQLAAANGKVSNNEQNQYLLSTILAHFKPTTSIVA